MLFNQEKRLLQITLPTDDPCVLVNLEGEEKFSDLFHYQCDIVSSNTNLLAKNIVGKCVGIKIMQTIRPEPICSRYIHGMVKQISEKNITTYNASNTVVRKYHLIVVPSLALLTLSSHCRVFQKKGQTVSGIVRAILKNYAININTQFITSDVNHSYCMQYNESDFDFIQRILADAGFFYYFKHTKDRHELILADSTQAYFTTDISELSFQSNVSGDNAINKFSSSQQLMPGKFATTDRLLDQSSKNLYRGIDVVGSEESTVNFYYPGNIDSTTMAQEVLKRQAEQVESREIDITMDVNRALQIGQLINLTGDYFNDRTVKKIVINKIKLTINDSQGMFKPIKKNYNNIVVNATEAQHCWRPLIKLTVANPGLQIATVVNKGGGLEKPVDADKAGCLVIKFTWEDYPDSGIESNSYDQYRISTVKNWDDGVYRAGTPVIVGFIDNNLDSPVILGAINTDKSNLLGTVDSSNSSQSIVQRIPGIDKTPYNRITLDDKEEKQQLTLTAVKELVASSKKESFTSEEHERTIKNKYQLKAGEENYQSDKLQRKVNGSYELTANGIKIHGDLTLTGNLIVNGDLDIN